MWINILFLLKHLLKTEGVVNLKNCKKGKLVPSQKIMNDGLRLVVADQ